MTTKLSTLYQRLSSNVLSGKGRLRGPNRASGQGAYKAPRESCQPGNITRREWLRFLRHVTIASDLCTCTGTGHTHWLWMGAHDRHGYGYFQWRGRTYPAYRFAVIAMGRSIPSGLEADHLCRVHACCTPDCLEIVTKAVNALRGEGVPAKHARQTHCKYGHLLAGDNLYAPRLAKGERVCLICMRAKYERREAKRRAALAARGPLPKQTHCKNGHLLEGENLQPYEWRVKGQRVCRTCVRQHERDRRKT